MKILRIGSIIVLLFLVTSCASNQYVIKTDKPIGGVTGVVFGRITLQRFFGLFQYNSDASMGRGVGLRNVENNEILGVTGLKFFVLELPVGTYEIISMGSPAGYLAPKDKAFKFNVEKGKVKYIGAIVGDRDLKRYFDKISIDRKPSEDDIKAYKIYGLGQHDNSWVGRPTYVGGEPFLDFFIIDESEEAIEKFKSDFPKYSESGIVKSLIY